MGRIFHPLLALLASATRQELARQVAYLNEENRILRARLPERIVATPQERKRLLRVGRRLGAQLRELMSFVSYQTFRRWIREAEEYHTKSKPASNRKPGRPRTPEEVRDLVIQMRKETEFGYTKLMGELRKLGIKISRQTVKNILKEAGLEPGPDENQDTWDAFLKRHADTLWQCDFVTKKLWTVTGLVDLYLLVLTAVESGGGGRVSRRSKVAAHNRAVLRFEKIGVSAPMDLIRRRHEECESTWSSGRTCGGKS